MAAVITIRFAGGPTEHLTLHLSHLFLVHSTTTIPTASHSNAFLAFGANFSN
jgi:hypothetical protein